MWKSRGNNNFPEIGGKCIETAKIELIEKGRQKFWRMKSKFFFGKCEIVKIFDGVWQFFGNRGNLKNGGMHRCLRGDGRSCNSVKRSVSSEPRCRFNCPRSGWSPSVHSNGQRWLAISVKKLIDMEEGRGHGKACFKENSSLHIFN